MSFSSPDGKRLESMKVTELRSELKRFNLPHGGVKKELVERLRSHLQQSQQHHEGEGKETGSAPSPGPGSASSPDRQQHDDASGTAYTASPHSISVRSAQHEKSELAQPETDAIGGGRGGGGGDKKQHAGESGHDPDEEERAERISDKAPDEATDAADSRSHADVEPKVLFDSKEENADEAPVRSSEVEPRGDADVGAGEPMAVDSGAAGGKDGAGAEEKGSKAEPVEGKAVEAASAEPHEDGHVEEVTAVPGSVEKVVSGARLSEGAGPVEGAGDEGDKGKTEGGSSGQEKMEVDTGEMQAGGGYGSGPPSQEAGEQENAVEHEGEEEDMAAGELTIEAEKEDEELEAEAEASDLAVRQGRARIRDGQERDVEGAAADRERKGTRGRDRDEENDRKRERDREKERDRTPLREKTKGGEQAAEEARPREEEEGERGRRGGLRREDENNRKRPLSGDYDDRGVEKAGKRVSLPAVAEPLQAAASSPSSAPPAASEDDVRPQQQEAKRLRRWGSSKSTTATATTASPATAMGGGESGTMSGREEVKGVGSSPRVLTRGEGGGGLSRSSSAGGSATAGGGKVPDAPGAGAATVGAAAAEAKPSSPGGEASGVPEKHVLHEGTASAAGAAAAAATKPARTVPPASEPPTDSLRIDNFVRPFTQKQVQELLSRHGKTLHYWMDSIRTHCYVTYGSVEEAEATRQDVYGLQWPPRGGNILTAKFVPREEVLLKVNPPAPKPAPAPAAPSAAAPTGAGAGAAAAALPTEVKQQEQLGTSKENKEGMAGAEERADAARDKEKEGKAVKGLEGEEKKGRKEEKPGERVNGEKVSRTSHEVGGRKGSDAADMHKRGARANDDKEAETKKASASGTAKAGTKPGEDEGRIDEKGRSEDKRRSDDKAMANGQEADRGGAKGSGGGRGHGNKADDVDAGKREGAHAAAGKGKQASDTGSKEKSAPADAHADTEAEEDLPTLDDLFRKTSSKPHIYFLPLTDEQVAAKLAVAAAQQRAGVAAPMLAGPPGMRNHSM